MSEQFAIRGLVAYKSVAFKDIVYKIKMIKPRVNSNSYLGHLIIKNLFR